MCQTFCNTFFCQIKSNEIDNSNQPNIVKHVFVSNEVDFSVFLNIDDDTVPVPNDKNASVILIETVP